MPILASAPALVVTLDRPVLTTGDAHWLTPCPIWFGAPVFYANDVHTIALGATFGDPLFLCRLHTPCLTLPAEGLSIPSHGPTLLAVVIPGGLCAVAAFVVTSGRLVLTTGDAHWLGPFTFQVRLIWFDAPVFYAIGVQTIALGATFGGIAPFTLLLKATYFVILDAALHRLATGAGGVDTSRVGVEANKTERTEQKCNRNQINYS